jgi:hypothetical protein
MTQDAQVMPVIDKSNARVTTGTKSGEVMMMPDKCLNILNDARS